MSKYKKELALVFIALAVYLPLFFYSRHLAKVEIDSGFPADSILPVYGSDSGGFVSLSTNLLNFGVLSHSSAPPFYPETFRTPGYPFMLAAWQGIFGGLTYFPFLQIALVIFSAILILRVSLIFFSANIGLAAAIIFILDPNVIYHSLVLLSEVPFLILFVWSVYLLFAAKKGFVLTKEAWAGIALAAATLVKPVTTFIPIVFVGAFIIWHWKPRSTFFKRAFIPLLAFVLSYSVILLPWIFRNYVEIGKVGISSVGAYNLFHYTVPEYISIRDSVSPDEARRLLESRIPKEALADYASLEYSDVIVKKSLNEISGNWPGFAKFYAVKTIPLFLSSGFENAFATVNDIYRREVFAVNNENMSSLILNGDWKGFISSIKSYPFISGEQIFFAVIVLLSIAAIFVRKDQRGRVILLWAVIAYFAAVTGPVAYARFRLPITPFLFILAAVGFSASMGPIWRKIRSREKGKNSALLYLPTTNQKLLTSSSAKFLPSASRKVLKGK